MSRAAAPLLAVLLVLAPATPARAWGLKAHRWINQRAIELLPEPLRAAYRRERSALAEAAVAPDLVLRKRDGEREGIRHYIRLENYGADVEALAALSRSEAERRFGKRKVRRAGHLPWVILDHARGIERAMRRGDWAAALRTSGYGGHYLADGLMPLHTSANFDGQLSAAGGGLHEELERDLVDADLASYIAAAERQLAPARSTAFSRASVIALLRDVNADVRPLVAAHEAAARAGSVGSATYRRALEHGCRAILERRLGDAATAVASLWLSSWVAAGRPSPPTAR